MVSTPKAKVLATSERPSDNSESSSSPRPIPSSQSRPKRASSRSFSINYPVPMPPVMSRENSMDNLHHIYEEGDRSGITMDAEPSPSPQADSRALSHSLEDHNLAGPSRYMLPPSGRKPSKSISSTKRPPISGSPRTLSYIITSPSSNTHQSLDPVSPVTEKRAGLTRRISTPLIVPTELASSATSKGKAVQTRARATSTSVALPVELETELSATYPQQSSTTSLGLEAPRSRPNVPQMDLDSATYPPLLEIDDSPATPSTSILTSVYDIAESAISSVFSFARPRSTYDPARRHSDDSDRLFSDDEVESGGSSITRTSSDSASESTAESRQAHVGRFWGMEEKEDYFSRPPSPDAQAADETDMFLSVPGSRSSLPTPALSSHSLSRTIPRRSHGRRSMQESWSARLGAVWTARGSSKTAEVVREMGWTVGLIATLFVVSLGFVVLAIGSMPITTLKHLPTSTTDLQLLSAEIRSYMAASDALWWHTILVVTYVGCWKHAWSVPGAVVLNILVGSLLEPMPALALLTFITATGSLGAYLLSRPLAPLIGVLFPKPLSLVRAALAPESAPPASDYIELVTPIEIAPDQPRIGGEEAKHQVWRRLLIMRAGGFVPWSGMNVACGVVGVDWKTFWLTTAAGSASWSYVTASVGNILSRLAVPSSTSSIEEGESLTSLLRDPSLIFKLVILSLLTLIPVLMKRKKSLPSASEPTVGLASNSIITDLQSASTASSSPMSPVSTSLSTFSPTPAPFDLLSFARTGVRQGTRVVIGGARGAVSTVGRAISGLKH